jgi:hypothetical protein
VFEPPAAIVYDLTIPLNSYTALHLYKYQQTLEITSSYSVTAWSLHNTDGTTWYDSYITLNNFLPKSTHALIRSDVYFSYTLTLRATVSTGFVFDQTLQIRVCGIENLVNKTETYIQVVKYVSAPTPTYENHYNLYQFFDVDPFGDVC